MGTDVEKLTLYHSAYGSPAGKSHLQSILNHGRDEQLSGCSVLVCVFVFLCSVQESVLSNAEVGGM